MTAGTVMPVSGRVLTEWARNRPAVDGAEQELSPCKKAARTTPSPGRCHASRDARASSPVMRERNGMTGAGHGACRLVVLALTLIGFLAMHGIASANGEHSHCAVPDTLISAAGPAGHDMPGGDATTTAGTHSHPAADLTLAASGDPRDEGGMFMTGCLLALLGAVVALALRLVRLAAGIVTPTPASATFRRRRAARAPPQPLFLSLCVIRL